MEESSEVHMEPDVSSTSVGVAEVPVVTGSHCNMETVVTVEEIKEEDMSPRKEKSKDPPKQVEGKIASEPVKAVDKLPEKEVPLKKIIIKTANKDFQIVKILPKTPTKPDGSSKLVGNDALTNISVQPSISQPSISIVLTNNESLTSLNKDSDKNAQISTLKNADSQESEQETPVTDPQPNKTVTKETLDRTSTKESPKTTPIKEQPTSKGQFVKISPAKEKELANSTLVKDQSPKSSPAKSASVNPSNKYPAKDQPAKTTLNLVSYQSNKIPANDQPAKATPTKDQPVKILTKDSPVKLTLTKDQPIKVFKLLTKDPPAKSSLSNEQPAKSTPAKELSNQVTLVKDQPSKATSGKELFAKSTPKDVSVLEKSIAEDINSSKSDEGSSKRTNIVSAMEIDREASNDSQLETNSDTSEKEHRGISRELRSLINSAKESKIISECTQLTSKTRKSRTPLDTSMTNLNTSVEADKIQGIRRGSDNSQKSGSSEKSERTLKRSMRSQNPEFVSKVKLFLNSVTGKAQKGEEDMSDEELDEDKPKETINEPSGTPKKKKTEESAPQLLEQPNKPRSDLYCWRCHWAVEHQASEKTHAPVFCMTCPRTYHYKCLTGPERCKLNTEKKVICPECTAMMHAESSASRSPAMKKVPQSTFLELLKYALERMMEVNGVEPFLQPVDRSVFPDYDKYVVHPMDLTLMKDKCGGADGYGSTERFLADAQWILHNSIIFNTLQSKLTAGARALVRSCRAEVGEIEACPECYAAAHARRPTWFTDVCSTPHVLLWAKLKGFPYWPAKGMSVSSAGLVDARFFGAHDRAWVPARDCFLYSEKDPNNFRTKRQDILASMQEAEHHIRNISRKYGKFVYPPFKTPFDPAKLNEQLKLMIPSFEGEVRTATKEKPSNTSPGMVKDKARSASKSSKGSGHDGDTSEGEDAAAARPRKMADGAEIAREEEDFVVDKEKDKAMELDVPEGKEGHRSRKRRRSHLEEAVITIIDSSSSEKRKRVENDDKPQNNKSSESKEANKNAPESPKIVIETPKNGPVTAKNSIGTSKNALGTPRNALETAKNDQGTPKNAIGTPKNAMGTPRNDVETPKNDQGTPKNAIGTPKNALGAPKNALGTPKNDQGTPKNATSTPKNDQGTPKKAAETSKDDPISQKDPLEMSKVQEKPKRLSTPRSKNNEPSTSTVDKKSTPKGISRLISITKVLKTAKVNTSKAYSPTGSTEKSQLKQQEQQEKSDSTVKETNQEENSKPKRHRNSRSNKSLNSSNAGKSDEGLEKKNERSTENKEKPIGGNNATNKSSDTNKLNADKSAADKSSSGSSTSDSPKPTKDRLLFDDDTSLAMLARTGKSSNVITSVLTSVPGLPTISCVRSLSNPEATTRTTAAKKHIEITVEAASDSSVFSPTSTDNVRNMKEAVSKLQKLRSVAEPPVGRVGVRAFARMTSPPAAMETSPNDVQVEIKTEPMELDDADRHMEKMDLMNAFQLRPVTAPSNLREVRISKVAVPPPVNRKVAPKPAEPRPRAKKTFPQPKKPEDGRSELVNKNSMVYIPIQPPTSQAPVRAPRPSSTGGSGVAPPAHRLGSPATCTTTTNNMVNTVTSPLIPMTMSTLSSSGVTSSANAPNRSPLQCAPTIGQVPTNVHTVPLITSVNGQWTFSLQPIMSVGGVDEAPSPPMVNGLAERGAAPAQAPTLPLLPAQKSKTSGENSMPGEPPKLQQRPSLINPLDANAPMGTVPPPSTAGPLTAKLNQNAVKMTDFFRTLLEDSLEKLEEPSAQLTAVKLQVEQASWRHQQQLEEVKHNHELTLAEMRSSFEKEKIRLVSETRRAAQVELESAVKLAKSKQWCANCSQEAQFYCCWNTSYCDYPCQRAHWAQHFSVCTQQRPQDGSDGNGTPDSRLQPAPENLPKTTAAPNLTVGGKLAPSRVYTQEQHLTPKPSIIMSMVEDTSGNQTLKCVGTYKPPAPAQMSPLILNKQLLTSEEAAKKVVTSGGYLIVGAASSGTPVTTTALVAQPRRTHTIQYYT